jgi:hypothetical protein
MVAAFAQVDDEVHVESAARAEEHRRLPWLQARAVGGDQHVRLQEGFVFGTELLQAWRSDFLTRFL